MPSRRSALHAKSALASGCVSKMKLLIAFFASAILSNTFSAALKFNNQKADVALVVEILAAYDSDYENFASSIRQIADRLPLAGDKMRLAVVEIDENGAIDVLLKLNDGIKTAEVRGALEKIEPPKKRRDRIGGDRNETELASKIRNAVFKEIDGDRFSIPNIVVEAIWIGDYRTADDQLFEKRGARKSDIALIATTRRGMKIFSQILPEMPMAFETNFDGAVEIARMLLRMLRSCPFDEKSTPCFYDSSESCVEIAQRIPKSNNVDYCLRDEIEMCRSGNRECDRRCRNFEEQISGGGRRKRGTAIANESAMFYENCPRLKSLANDCRNGSCSSEIVVEVSRGARKKKSVDDTIGENQDEAEATTNSDDKVKGKNNGNNNKQPDDKVGGMKPWLIALIVGLIVLAMIILAGLVGYFAVGKRRRHHHRRHRHHRLADEDRAKPSKTQEASSDDPPTTGDPPLTQKTRSTKKAKKEKPSKSIDRKPLDKKPSASVARSKPAEAKRLKELDSNSGVDKVRGDRREADATIKADLGRTRHKSGYITMG